MATVRVGEFEWDERKADANLAKHGISFQEAMTVFLDELAVPFLRTSLIQSASFSSATVGSDGFSS